MPPDVQDVVDQIDQPAPPAPAPAAEPAAVTPADPDDAEVAAALAAAEAEAKGAPAQPAPSAAPQAQPQPAAPAAAQPPAPQAPAQEPIMIPKARFDDVLSKSSEKDLQIARLQGENEALKLANGKPANGQPAQQPQQPAETFEQKVDRIYAAKEALATKFDNGEMSLAEMRREERKLDTELDTAREARLADRVKAQSPQPQAQSAPSMTLALENELAAIQAKHLYLQTPEVMRDDRWEFLKVEAAQQLRDEGVALPPPGQPLTEKQRVQLGERIAVLSDTYGPIWGAKPAQAPAPQPSAQPTKPAVVVARENKLTQAHNAPPDLNRLTPQGGQTEFTEDMIAGMSDDEILALPASVRARFSTNAT